MQAVSTCRTAPRPLGLQVSLEKDGEIPRPSHLPFSHFSQLMVLFHCISRTVQKVLPAHRAWTLTPFSSYQGMGYGNSMLDLTRSPFRLGLGPPALSPKVRDPPTRPGRAAPCSVCSAQVGSEADDLTAAPEAWGNQHVVLGPCRDLGWGMPGQSTCVCIHVCIRI